jgi:hypothetical protein
MPLIRYFGFVGSALVLLLIGMGWCFPQHAVEPSDHGAERPVIRIRSVEPLPERVIIDTSVPTIVPSLSIDAVLSTTVMGAHQLAQSASAELDVSPMPAAPKSADEVSKTKQIAKREPAQKVVGHRAAKPLNFVPAPMTVAQGAAPDARMSLLETWKERLGQKLFKLN